MFCKSFGLHISDCWLLTPQEKDRTIFFSFCSTFLHVDEVCILPLAVCSKRCFCCICSLAVRPSNRFTAYSPLFEEEEVVDYSSLSWNAIFILCLWVGLKNMFLSPFCFEVHLVGNKHFLALNLL